MVINNSMSKNSAIIGLGVLVAILPFSGFPIAVKEVIFIVAGLIIAVIGYFSNVQYCANCKRVIENGHYGNGRGVPPTMGKELKDESKKDISGISPPELK